MENFDWKELNAKLPCKMTPESVEARKKLWRRIDNNGNGYLSLAEVDKGIRDDCHLDKLFNAKPVLMRAFTAAKNKGKAKSKYSDDYVEFHEFRYLLIYLRQYAEYFVMFNRIDQGNDKKVNLAEFKLALPQLKEWGVVVENAEATFGEIDANGGGEILFEEFVNWAIAKQLDLTDDDDDFQ
jgi:Ca2+-binding EF-hand superfamily protein